MLYKLYIMCLYDCLFSQTPHIFFTSSLVRYFSFLASAMAVESSCFARLINWLENNSKSSPVTSNLMLPFPFWIIANMSVIGFLKLPVVRLPVSAVL